MLRGDVICNRKIRLAIRGIGIKPDIEIKETLENYLSGKDVVLEAALKYMGTKSLK